MLKKAIKIIISIVIIMFSFFYTNNVIKAFRDNDPIMIEIKSYSDSDLENKKIVDIDKSYHNMKRTGKFDKNLLVFREINNKDKLSYKDYIESLNKNDNVVSLIFIFRNTDNIISILKILDNNKVNATFFLSKTIFDNSKDLVKLIYDSGNEIELLSDNYSIYEVNKYSSLLKMITKDKLNYCINFEKNEKILKACESSNLYTISPNKEIKNNLYLYVKNNLSDGLLIALDNSNKNVKELSSTITYLIQKGKKFVMLNNK